MDSSQIFGFLQILTQSTQIFFKNLKLLAPITALSLLLSSVIFLLFSYSHQCVTAYMANSFTGSTSGVPFLQIAIYFALILAVDLAFMISYIALAHVAGVATVILAATSLADAELSLRDLYARTGAKSKIPFRKNLPRGSVKPMHLLSIFAVAVAVPLVILNPNPVTIAVVSVAGVSVFVYHLYASVAQTLVAVIPVVEDGCEAAEKAEKLVEGQRLHGFMVNLFVNALGVIGLWSLWMIVGDKGSLNITVYGLFIINCVTASRVFVGIVYTVYYFRCKEYHGEKVVLFGNFHYTTLKNDIP